ncbi:MAG TPA: hypothetical protein DCL38_06285 [Lachnospiraceae bacterium]|nr:hypothetical protein [Lachnospiraceae bacterium]
MKAVFIGAVTVLVCVLLVLKKEYRRQVIAGYLIIVILFSAFYNFRFAGTIVDFYRPTDQSFFQREFLESGEYPDSLLPLILQGKTVYTKDDRFEDFEEAEKYGKNWLYGFYHAANDLNYLRLAGAEVVKDEGMNGTMLSDEGKKDFERLGPANDMFRYSFICSKFKDEIGNFFNYYWYYCDYLPEIAVYLNISEDSEGKDIGSSDELVVLWENPEELPEGDNFYVMTKAYYEENVR